MKKILAFQTGTQEGPEGENGGYEQRKGAKGAVEGDVSRADVLAAIQTAMFILLKVQWI
jgi:hypothetical protein